MRVTIERSAFLKALNHVQSVVERRNTIPILSNVLIQAGGRSCASPPPISISRSSKPSPPMWPRTARPPCRPICSMTSCASCPDGAQLEIEQGPDAGRVSVFAGTSRFALQALPPEDFPDLAMPAI